MLDLKSPSCVMRLFTASCSTPHSCPQAVLEGRTQSSAIMQSESMHPVLRGSAAVRQLIATMKVTLFLMHIRNVRRSKPIPQLTRLTRFMSATSQRRRKQRIICRRHAPRAVAESPRPTLWQFGCRAGRRRRRAPRPLHVSHSN